MSKIIIADLRNIDNEIFEELDREELEAISGGSSLGVAELRYGLAMEHST
jgi:bacteriocin-like protein